MNEPILIGVGIYIVLAVLVGLYASIKKRSGIIFFLVSLCFSPLIAIVVFNTFYSKKGSELLDAFYKCPFCAKRVSKGAENCGFCGKKLPKDLDVLSMLDIKMMMNDTQKFSHYKIKAEDGLFSWNNQVFGSAADAIKVAEEYEKTVGNVANKEPS